MKKRAKVATPNWRDTLFFGKMLTEEQEAYVDAIFNKQLIIVDAKSGCGKTTLAVASAKLLNKELVYLFAPVQERVMGHRPGEQSNKNSAYLIPLVDALIEINEDPAKAIKTDENQKCGDAWVTASSHTFLRGSNIVDKVVIIDEAQNWTVGELKKTLTRGHDNTKFIVIGNMGQKDVKYNSGFPIIQEHFKDKDYCSICTLTKNFRGQLSQDADELPD